MFGKPEKRQARRCMPLSFAKIASLGPTSLFSSLTGSFLKEGLGLSAVGALLAAPLPLTFDRALAFDF
jgi:hypothetical protein